MARSNVAAASESVVNLEGGRSARQTAIQELTRTVASCMLFEQTFYGSGAEIAERISGLCDRVTAEQIAVLAHKARHEWHLRHISLFLALEVVRKQPGRLAGETVDDVILRADELAEILAIYWRAGKRPLANQLKLGIATAFQRFDEHQLAKWNSPNKITLRDALFLCHAKPENKTQAKLWKALVDGRLKTPDTWEVALSAGKDKKATWTRLLKNDSLSILAILRNLRNMEEAGVDRALVAKRLRLGDSRVLPFRFIAAVRAAPMFLDAIQEGMTASLKGARKLKGSTAIVIDVSPSMDVKLSEKSDISRMDAACALAVLLAEVCPDLRVFSFSQDLVEVPAYGGLALVDIIKGSQVHNGTLLAKSLTTLQAKCPDVERVIIVTDEQSQDGIIHGWAPRSYLVNVAPHEAGLSLAGGWNRINGWSDRIVEWIQEDEVAG